MINVFWIVLAGVLLWLASNYSSAGFVAHEAKYRWIYHTVSVLMCIAAAVISVLL